MKLIGNNPAYNYLCVAYQLITNAEGFSQTWYNDIFGNATIGYGFTQTGYARLYIPEYISNPSKLMAISEARIILNNIIENIDTELINAIDFFNTDLLRNQKAVLIDMAYNLGMAQFRTFDTFLSYLKSGRIDDAVCDLTNTLWYNQVKNRAIRDCLNLYAQDINYYLI
jgi:GH24 family phage-related lysozyme (muramidase)